MTLALPKTGLLASEARNYVDRLSLGEIGVPPELYRKMRMDVDPIFVEDSVVDLVRLGLR